MSEQTEKSGAKSLGETHEEATGQSGWAPEILCASQRLAITAALHQFELHYGVG